MKNFSDFNIETPSNNFEGDKIKIDRILNREIIVHGYSLKPSKFEDNASNCLCLQISIADNKHIVFTGSTILIDMIQKVSKSDFPFKTVIEKTNQYFKFT